MGMSNEPTWDEIQAAKPAAERYRRSDAPARRRPPERTSDYPGRRNERGGQGSSEQQSLGDIEERMSTCEEELAALADALLTAEREAAEAKADWHRHRDTVLLHIANTAADQGAKDTREARAKGETDPHTGMTGEDLYAKSLITEAHAKGVAKALAALQSRASLLQSLAKGVRYATGTGQY